MILIMILDCVCVGEIDPMKSKDMWLEILVNGCLHLFDFLWYAYGGIETFHQKEKI